MAYIVSLMREFILLLVFWITAPVTATPVISEFMASNEETLADEDGDFPDWIEIFNPSDEPVDLTGYFLTDDALVLNQWEFPQVTLGAGELLIVFASGKDRDVGELHTNFKLASEGEYLALVAADGSTVVSDFGEKFPPQFQDVSFGEGDFGIGYLDEATPGETNSDGQLPGPFFLEALTGGPRPEPFEPVMVTARVVGAEDLTIFYRKDFGDEVPLAMTSANGEDFTVEVPGDAPGALIRWRFVAQDADGRVTKYPAFRDPEDSHEYFGIPVTNANVDSAADVFEWFISPVDYDRLIVFQPVRAGVFYLGEYYDNVRFTVHGQSSAFFAKKSFNMDFNKTQRFLWREGEGRVKDLDILSNWGDKSKSRNELAYEILRESGVPTHFAFTVRVQRNGNFFSLADIVEDADDRYLERAGLNEDGVLYKPVNSTLDLEDLKNPLEQRVRKRTRKDEGFQDLADFIRGINQEGADRWDYIFDNVDLPMTINTLAGLVVIMQTDMVGKNYYVYRDTGGDNEWAILPWDLDLTFGRNFTSRAGYFDTNLFYENYTEFRDNNDVISLVRSLIWNNDATRDMFFRRVRTLSDRFVDSDYIQTRLLAQLNRLSSPDTFPGDALTDSFAWGTWYDNDPVPRPFSTIHPDSEDMERAVVRIVNEWLPLRHAELYLATPDLPEAQENEEIMIGSLDFDPISDNQDQEYIELINQHPFAADVSGWRVDGAVRFILPEGTVIPSGSSLFLSPNKADFRTRDLSPTGNEQRFVVGPYKGNLSAEGETIDLYDPDDVLRDSKTFSGSQPGFNGNGTVDKDGDGLNALFEWALGSSDEIYNSLEEPAVGKFTYSAQSDLNGFSLVVEVSENLLDWTREGVVESERVALDEVLDRVTIDLPPGLSRCFVRLVLERLP